jgi:hypothetical protein
LVTSFLVNEGFAYLVTSFLVNEGFAYLVTSFIVNEGFAYLVTSFLVNDRFAYLVTSNDMLYSYLRRYLDILGECKFTLQQGNLTIIQHCTNTHIETITSLSASVIMRNLDLFIWTDAMRYRRSQKVALITSYSTK